MYLNYLCILPSLANITVSPPHAQPSLRARVTIPHCICKYVNPSCNSSSRSSRIVWASSWKIRFDPYCFHVALWCGWSPAICLLVVVWIIIICVIHRLFLSLLLILWELVFLKSDDIILTSLSLGADKCQGITIYWKWRKGGTQLLHANRGHNSSLRYPWTCDGYPGWVLKVGNKHSARSSDIFSLLVCSDSTF